MAKTLLNRLTGAAPRVLAVRTTAGAPDRLHPARRPEDGWRLVGPMPAKRSVVVRLAGPQGRADRAGLYRAGQRDSPAQRRRRAVGLRAARPARRERGFEARGHRRLRPPPQGGGPRHLLPRARDPGGLCPGEIEPPARLSRPPSGPSIDRVLAEKRALERGGAGQAGSQTVLAAWEEQKAWWSSDSTPTPSPIRTQTAEQLRRRRRRRWSSRRPCRRRRRWSPRAPRRRGIRRRRAMADLPGRVGRRTTEREHHGRPAPGSAARVSSSPLPRSGSRSRRAAAGDDRDGPMVRRPALSEGARRPPRPPSWRRCSPRSRPSMAPCPLSGSTSPTGISARAAGAEALRLPPLRPRPADPQQRDPGDRRRAAGPLGRAGPAIELYERLAAAEPGRPQPLRSLALALAKRAESAAGRAGPGRSRPGHRRSSRR